MGGSSSGIGEYSGYITNQEATMEKYSANSYAQIVEQSRYMDVDLYDDIVPEDETYDKSEEKSALERMSQFDTFCPEGEPNLPTAIYNAFSDTLHGSNLIDEIEQELGIEIVFNVNDMTTRVLGLLEKHRAKF